MGLLSDLVSHSCIFCICSQASVLGHIFFLLCMVKTSLCVLSSRRFSVPFHELSCCFVGCHTQLTGISLEAVLFLFNASCPLSIFLISPHNPISPCLSVYSSPPPLSNMFSVSLPSPCFSAAVSSPPLFLLPLSPVVPPQLPLLPSLPLVRPLHSLRSCRSRSSSRRPCKIQTRQYKALPGPICWRPRPKLSTRASLSGSRKNRPQAGNPS